MRVERSVEQPLVDGLQARYAVRSRSVSCSTVISRGRGIETAVRSGHGVDGVCVFVCSLQSVRSG